MKCLNLSYLKHIYFLCVDDFHLKRRSIFKKDILTQNNLEIDIQEYRLSI